MQSILLAVAIGAAFGFVLDRIGATNPGLIISMLRLGRLRLMKTILLGIGFASVSLFAGLMLGLIDPGHLSVKSAYLGVFVGGLLLGTGFALAGYCPGTGLAAAATGRMDALVFVLGGLAGAAAYMAAYAGVATTGILEPVAGGKATLGAISGTSYPVVFSSLPGEAIGIVLGVCLMLIAAALPDRLRTGRPNPEEGETGRTIGA